MKEGTLTVEKAKVNGAEVTTKDKRALEDLLEKVDLEREADEASYRLVDVELSSEIVSTLRGHFAANLIYNIPRRSGTGRTEWRECDLIDGGCPYKGKTSHIHILGVGYQGALTAMRAYGRLHAVVEDMPEIVEQGDKLYWAAYGVASDGHTGNEIGRWYFEAVMRKAGNRFIENEFGASIAQSKSLRNVILALIPAKLMEGWIEDYREGKQAFNVQRAKDMGYGPQKTEDKPKGKRERKPKNETTTSTPGDKDLSGVITKLAQELSVDEQSLEEYYAGAGLTKGQAMLRYSNALNDEAQLNELSGKLDKWIESQKDNGDTEGGNVKMDPAEEKDLLNTE